MRRASLIAGTVLLPFGWASAGGGSMTGHMVGHMLAVAVAAPLLAWGLGGTLLDPAMRWPRLVTPLAMSLAELVVVWGWHLPLARALAQSSFAGLVAEQAMFLAAGVLLWAAVLGTGAERRAAGVAALLLTTMHMTLLGALIALAPRPLYASMAHGPNALDHQQLSGVVMLLVGAGCYLIGALAMLGTILSGRGERS
jgi:putative membrane protein